MAKSQTLKAALDRHKGVDHKLERQKKQQKAAENKRKQKTREEDDEQGAEGVEVETFSDEEEVDEQLRAQIAQELAREGLAADAAEAMDVDAGEGAGWETDGSEDAEDDEDEDEEGDEEGHEKGGVDLNMLEDESESDEEDDIMENGVSDEEDDDNEGDIPLSDIESLASEDKGDVIPHQRLTINNTAALLRSLKSFALPSSLPFSATQAVTSTSPVEIADADDDLNRELALYKQSLDAVKEARTQLKKEGAPFSRPADFFAEMVKSEEQMGRVRQKVVDEAARKKASADARRQRDLKKFGKAVQVAKLQERDKAKRDTLEKINVLKRKRQGGTALNANEDSMFDVALEDAAETEKADRAARRGKSGSGAGAPPKRKRQMKDEKFGFGGKKRFAKSNDARSSADTRAFSVKKMKGKGAGGKRTQRPGKSRRAARS